MKICERCNYEIVKNEKNSYGSYCTHFLSHKTTSIQETVWWALVDEKETDDLFLGKGNPVPCRFLSKSANKPSMVRLKYSDNIYKDACPSDISSKWETTYFKPPTIDGTKLKDIPDLAPLILVAKNMTNMGISGLDLTTGSETFIWHKCIRCGGSKLSKVKYLVNGTKMCDQCLNADRANKVAEIRIAKRTEKTMELINASLVENLGYGKGVYSCEICKTEYVVKHSNIQECHDSYGTNCCPTCKANRTHSILEGSLFSFVSDMYSGEIIKQHKVDSYSVDLYIPELNLIIEADGAFWHSEYYPENTFKSLEKKNRYDELGIKSIFIRDLEWQGERSTIFKSKLINFLIKEKGIRASQTEIKALLYPEINDFLEQYHFMGKGEKTAMNYGLFFQNELIAVSSFKNREYGEVELVRFASSRKIYGGLAKMIKRLFGDHDHVKEIFTFADRRFSQKDNNIYTLSGFKFVKTSDPSYYWLHGRKIIPRRRAQKQFIPKEAGDMSEPDYFHSLGYVRVYDCGNYKYVLKRTKPLI